MIGDSGEWRGNKVVVGMQNLSSDSSGSSRDLLQRFMVASVGDVLEAAKDETEIELNLGLSLGGRFGVDRSSKNLGRSSSVASFLPSVREDAPPAEAAACTRLARTSSLPVETEEEWRKRKELQSLRRMQAKRRMSEKQRISRGDKGISAAVEDEKNFEKEQCSAAPKLFGLSLGLPAWEAAGQKGKGGDFSKALQPSPQGSIESQGGSSSSMSEFESKSLQGSCEHSPTSYQSTQDMHKKDAVGTSGVKTVNVGSRMAGTEMESTSDKGVSTSEKARKPGMEDMPCVFTKGDGPNGRRVDGILYKYGKGQEVRIMCVCHGSFLSPAEFVKHAGGTDVSHPLKHIVVNPNSSSSPFR